MLLKHEYRVLDASGMAFDKLNHVLSRLLADGWQVSDQSGEGLDQGSLRIVLSRTSVVGSKLAVA